MIGILNYLIQNTILFTIFWLLFVSISKNNTFFTLNRFFLVGLAIVTAFIPLLQVETTTQILPKVVLSEVTITNNYSSPNGNTPFKFNMANTIFFAYALGLLLSVFFFTLKFKRIIRLKKSSSFVSSHLAVLPVDSPLQAFTFLNTIYIHPSITSPDREVILRHESVHVKQRHYIDLMLFEILCCIFWFNPLYRWAKINLMATHEFIADELACGNNRLEYSQLLVTNALKLPASFFNSFSQTNNLKRRLIMLTTKKSNQSKRIAYLAAVPLCLTALFFQSFQLKMAEIPQVQFTSNPDLNLKNEVSKPKTGDKNAEFKGGFNELSKYLSSSILYPEEAKKQKIEGKVIIEFTVSKDGKINDPILKKGVHKLLDDEALRVVAAMPDWEPAISNGKKANSQMVLPIAFKL